MGTYAIDNSDGVQSKSAPENNVAEKASVNLARLVERQLGYADGHIDPIALRFFIRTYWSLITKLAHTIHEETP